MRGQGDILAPQREEIELAQRTPLVSERMRGQLEGQVMAAQSYQKLIVNLKKLRLPAMAEMLDSYVKQDPAVCHIWIS